MIFLSVFFLLLLLGINNPFTSLKVESSGLSKAIKTDRQTEEKKKAFLATDHTSQSLGRITCLPSCVTRSCRKKKQFTSIVDQTHTHTRLLQYEGKKIDARGFDFSRSFFVSARSTINVADVLALIITY